MSQPINDFVQQQVETYHLGFARTIATLITPQELADAIGWPLEEVERVLDPETYGYQDLPVSTVTLFAQAAGIVSMWTIVPEEQFRNVQRVVEGATEMAWYTHMKSNLLEAAR